MRVLIVGGTGLISTAITRELLTHGYDVTLINRGKTEARFPEGARFITCDRHDRANFEAAIRSEGPLDCVIDMICYTPADAESLVRATQGVARHVIFCSTVDVYQRPAARYPITEAEPRRGLSEYARQKILCEDMLMEAHRRGDFALTTIRPAQTYGEGGVIVHSLGWSTTYLDRIRKGKPVIVHGDGQSLWTACHADDVACAFVGAICNERAYGHAYHTTGEDWMTWNQYHETVAAALGAPPPTLVHIPTDLLVQLAPERAGICAANFQHCNILDNTAAKRDIGFRYTVPFLEGVRRTVAWLDDHGRIEDSDADPLDDTIIAAWSNLSARMVEQVRRGSA